MKATEAINGARLPIDLEDAEAVQRIVEQLIARGRSARNFGVVRRIEQ